MMNISKIKSVQSFRILYESSSLTRYASGNVVHVKFGYKPGACFMGNWMETLVGGGNVVAVHFDVTILKR